MNQPSKCLLIATVAALGLMIALGVNAAAPSPAPVSVNVVNTPLPVTGSVSVSGTSSVNASQNGNWSVGITNTAANPVPVRNVDRPDSAPFEVQTCISVPIEGCSGGYDVPFTVDNRPIQRVVIDYVSVVCGVTPATAIVSLVSMNTQVRGSGANYGFQPNFGFVDNANDERLQGVAQVTRIYADAGSSIFLGISEINVSSANCNVAISGTVVFQ